MVLGDDDVGPKRFKLLCIDVVDGEPFLQEALTRVSMSQLVPVTGNFGFVRGWQVPNIGRKVAFMRTAHKEVAGAERTDDLCRARDERHHAFGLSIGHLAPCYRPAATKTRNQIAV
jgi:hypothetical protein